MAFLDRIRKLIGLGAYQRPEGEPVLLTNGMRWGTRLPNGAVILESGVRFDRVLCSRCQQAIEAEGDHRQAAGVEHQAERTGKARVSRD